MKKEKEMTREKEPIVEALLKGWKETRQLTLDWIEALSVEQLNQELPRPGLNSYTKHIYEMGEVQGIYTAVLEGKEPDMAKVTSLTFESERIAIKTKDGLIQLLKECNARFYGAVNSLRDWQEKASVFGVEVPRFGVIELLIRHETLHHGQFIAFGYILGIQLPQSWIDVWALPTK